MTNDITSNSHSPGAMKWAAPFMRGETNKTVSLGKGTQTGPGVRRAATWTKP